MIGRPTRHTRTSGGNVPAFAPGAAAGRCEAVRPWPVRGKSIHADTLRLDDTVYQAGTAEEHFISYVTPDDGLAGFIRLSLPVGSEKKGAAQHAGLGTRLLKEAESAAQASGFDRLAVISAVGTREYYLERGFERGEFYLIKNIGKSNS